MDSLVASIIETARLLDEAPVETRERYVYCPEEDEVVLVGEQGRA